MTRPGIEPRSPRPLAKRLGWWFHKEIFTFILTTFSDIAYSALLCLPLFCVLTLPPCSFLLFIFLLIIQLAFSSITTNNILVFPLQLFCSILPLLLFEQHISSSINYPLSLAYNQHRNYFLSLSLSLSLASFYFLYASLTTTKFDFSLNISGPPLWLQTRPSLAPTFYITRCAYRQGDVHSAPNWRANFGTWRLTQIENCAPHEHARAHAHTNRDR